MCIFSIESFLKGFIYSFTICIAMDIGHSYLDHWANEKVSWINAPVKRLVLGINLMLGYSLFASVSIAVIFYFFIFKVFTIHTVSWQAIIDIAMIPVCISVASVVITTSWSFLSNWRQAAIDAERLKRENLQAQYNTLKNQINPHFLFNSFNVLTDLVYIDQDKAALFIQQLSQVFRNVLLSSKKEFVTLKTELEFLQSYIFLVRMRFGENLHIKISSDEFPERFIIPLCLQMLIENAVKHNIISSEEPLFIEVVIDEKSVTVINNLQRKNLAEATTGMGLDNIRARYEHMQWGKIKVEETREFFKVVVPLIVNG